MSGPRFFWRVYGTFVLLIILTAVTVGLLIHHPLRERSLEDIESRLVTKAIAARTIAWPEGARSETQDFTERIRKLGEELDARLTVIARDGTVLVDTEEDAAAMDNHGDRPEVREAVREGVGKSTRFSRTLGIDMIYVALPVEHGNEIVGFVRAAEPRVDVTRRLAEIRITVLLGAGAAVILALILALWVARRVTRPLESMTAVAESIASGNLDQRVDDDAVNEIGKLARAFNRMAASLRERIDTFNKNQDQLLAVLGGMVEGVIAVDQDERVVHMNRAAGEILKSSATSSAGRWIWEITNIREVIEAVGEVVREGVEIRREVEIRGAAQDQVIELNASPLRRAGAGAAGAVVVLHDITRLRELEVMRRDFVANVSHELKTPVAAVRAIVETIHDDAGMDPSTRERFLRKVLDQCTRLSALVTDLLALSRLESATGGPERYPVDVRSVVNEVVHSLLSMAEDKELALGVDVPEVAVEVEGDVEALHQLLTNLLDNAIKYTPRGGRVWVRLQTAGDRAILEVEDTGLGITRRDQKRIFERFYRVDKARSRELGGTGLGLSIVKHIVLSLGGRVAVESEPGRGSTFRVELPASPGQPSSERRVPEGHRQERGV